MTALVYRIDDGRQMVDCPLCERPARLHVQGSGVRVHCFNSACEDRQVDAMVEPHKEAILAEVADRPDGEAPVSRRDPGVERVPLELDFDAPPEAPDYLVQGLVERGTLPVLSGDTGAAKSIAAGDLIAACLVGRTWLGADVARSRVLVLDEENPRRLVTSRLRALGIANTHREGLRYFAGLGAALGAGDWLQWLRQEAEAHRAELVVIDTAAAATAVDVNDNTEVARLLGELRRIARDLHLVVLVLHHERKAQQGQTRDPGQSMMGARQWAGQADTHLSLAVSGPLVEEPAESGHLRLTREFKVTMPKSRDGESAPPELLVVTSEKDVHRRLLWMRVEARERDADDQVDARILTLLEANAPLSTAAIRTSLQVRKQAVSDALRTLEAAGLVERGDDGWTPVPKPGNANSQPELAPVPNSGASPVPMRAERVGTPQTPAPGAGVPTVGPPRRGAPGNGEQPSTGRCVCRHPARSPRAGQPDVCAVCRQPIAPTLGTFSDDLAAARAPMIQEATA